MKKLSLVLILMGGLLAGCVAYDAPGRGYGGNRVGPDYPRDYPRDYQRDSQRDNQRDNQREVEHERREQREHWRQDDAGRNDHERYGEGHPHDNRPRD